MVLLPLILLVSSEILKNKNRKDLDLYRIGLYSRELLIGCTLTLLLTEVAKSIIAEHRPHFLDVCEPDMAKGCVNGTWIEDFRCTTTKYHGYFLIDSSRSFPSGHSSISSFIGIYCAVSYFKVLLDEMARKS